MTPRPASCCGSGRPGAGADAPAITYYEEIDGEQYVAIAAGGQGHSDPVRQWRHDLGVQASNGGDVLKIAQMPAPPPPPTALSFEANSRLRTMRVRETDAIKMIDYEYEPTRIQVTTGTKVTFTNAGQQPHNAAGADAGGWDVGLLNNGPERRRDIQSSRENMFSAARRIRS